MKPTLVKNITTLINQFDEIEAERKERLIEIADYLRTEKDKICNIIFICTHNSRRSQIAQLMALAAMRHYGLAGIHCYSGGTKPTSFNQHAVQALKEFGFDFKKKKEDEVLYFWWKDMPEVRMFSKVYNANPNPKQKFCAIMTCSEADTQCPIVLGAETRISLPFSDPQEGDNRPDVRAYYEKTVISIGREVFFAFSKV